MKATPAFTTIDEYLDGISEENRKVLQHLREVIKSAAPQAEETIAYMMPAFKYKGALVYFAAFQKHCSFFPGGIVDGFKNELQDFVTAKGTIQFTPLKPLPDDLVRRIVQMRVEENDFKEELRKTKKKGLKG